MIIVTGGAGFIGSNLVQALNARGVDDILVVDNLARADKTDNLSDLRIADYMDKREFLEAARADKLGGVEAVLHQGACTDTMATDGRYIVENNFTYSKILYHFCARRRRPFIYASSASVYGGGRTFIEAPQYERTLNAYAWSKLAFDQFIRRRRPDFPCVGLRYFNVYGPREQHKGRMASLALHFFRQYQADKQVKLFAGYDGCADGEQRRDFVSVADAVKVNLFFLDHPARGGIYNVGSGHSCSINAMALTVVNACRKQRGAGPRSLRQAIAANEINYIPMPVALHGKYQNYTQANLENLRAAGYAKKFTRVTDGVSEYADALRRG